MSTTAAVSPSRRASTPFLARDLRTLILYVTLILLVILGLATSPTFSTSENLLNVLRQAVGLTFLAIGQTFVILLAGIDLSVGMMAALTSVLTAGTMAGFSERTVSATLVGLGAGLLVGTVNGLLVARTNIPPFIVTLGMMSIIQGSGLIYSMEPVGEVSRQFTFLAKGYIGPIPFPIILAAVVAVLAFVVLHHTAYGRAVYAVGGNEEIARLSGINVRRIKFVAYVICTMCATLTGLYWTSRMEVGDPLVGTGAELESITAVVLGGTSLFGGRGTIAGTVGGVIFVAVLNNIFNLLNVDGWWQQIIKGAFVIAVVASYRPKK